MPEIKISRERQEVILPGFGGNMRVKFKDVFDLKMFYETLKEWFLENGWRDEIDGLEHWETYYGERIAFNGMKEIWVQWRLFKQPEKAPFLAYYLDIDWHVLGLSDTEIVHAGRKIKTNKGEVELTIKPLIDKRFVSEFQKQSLLKEILPIFSQRIYKKELEQRKKELYQETYVLQNFIKQWFKLKRHLPYEEVKGFYPSAAFPSHLKET